MVNCLACEYCKVKRLSLDGGSWARCEAVSERLPVLQIVMDGYEHRQIRAPYYCPRLTVDR